MLAASQKKLKGRCSPHGGAGTALVLERSRKKERKGDGIAGETAIHKKNARQGAIDRAAEVEFPSGRARGRE